MTEDGDSTVEYFAFGVYQTTHIDIERYKAIYDFDTGATDFIYDNERLSLKIPQLYTPLDFQNRLEENGWRTVGPIDVAFAQFMATVERI